MSENSKKNIAKAIIQVMKEVKGMEKNSEVGSGSYGYKGTKDQDVKEVFNSALEKAGLCIVPIDIQEETQVDRWQESQTYQDKTTVKQKQSVFTKVRTKYLLLHESGESIELAGYGHGVDAQDKGAGKATTYALKNCLLYTFLTPVGKIDDSDTVHSEEIAVPVVKTNFHPDMKAWDQAIKKQVAIDQLKTKYSFSPENEKKYEDELNTEIINKT